MKGPIAAALGVALLGYVGFAGPLTVAQQDTAQGCREDRQAGTTTNQGYGVTEKAPVGGCNRDGAFIRPAGAPAPRAAVVAAAGEAADHGQAYSSIKDLMEAIIDPSADVLWGAVGTVVDQEGVHESLPRTQEEWFKLRRAAVRIIEGSNLLMMPARQAAPAGTKSQAPGVELEPAEIAALINGNRTSFDAFAEALRALGAEALRAAETRNADLLMDVGSRMEDACESCHKTFWYPQEKDEAR